MEAPSLDGVAEEGGSTKSQVLGGWQWGALTVASRGGVSSGFHFRKIFWSPGGGISWSTGVRPRVGAPPKVVRYLQLAATLSLGERTGYDQDLIQVRAGEQQVTGLTGKGCIWM